MKVSIQNLEDAMISMYQRITFFCQYAVLFDIYESFVVDEKEVRSKTVMRYFIF